MLTARSSGLTPVTRIGTTGGKDFIAGLNPNSLKVMTAFVEPSLAGAKADDTYQFERRGYFVADRVANAAAKPVFNLAVGLKDSLGKRAEAAERYYLQGFLIKNGTPE